MPFVVASGFVRAAAWVGSWSTRAVEKEQRARDVGQTAPGAGERASLVVRPGLFLTAVIASALAAGYVIYWLLRSMRI